MARIPNSPLHQTPLTCFESLLANSTIAKFKRWCSTFPRPTFLVLHWVYFIVTCFISSLLFWCINSTDISYVNSIFMVVAAMTQAGLNTVNLAALNLFQQVLLLVLMVAGNHILVSIIVIHVRRRAFEVRFKEEEEEDIQRSQFALKVSTPSSVFSHEIQNTPSHSSIAAQSSISTDMTIYNRQQYKPTHIDRNSQFHSLSIEERKRVRCVEYQAVKLLGYIVPAYYIIWQVIGCLALGLYISANKPSIATDIHTHPWWVAIYLGVAAFNNAGMSLLDGSVAPLQNSTFPLVVLSFLMMAGNTAYPIFLRWLLRLALRIIPDNEKFSDWTETLRFILRFPRRVYTNLFPSEQTWWLLALLIFFNAFDWTAFEILNHYSVALRSIPMGPLVLDGLFQTIAIRSSGFTVIPIASLFVGLQSLYVLMMYISAFPVTITMRSSNVYEERSLGIYTRDVPKTSDPEKSEDCQAFKAFPTRHLDRFYFVQEQIRRQLGHDLWFLVIGMMIITCFESTNYERDPLTFALFNIIFEIISAYGGVGFSVGLPDQAYSFCGAWHPFSRLILCAMMMRGRHRGLPFDIDKAIQLPGEKSEIAEEQDHNIRIVSWMTDRIEYSENVKTERFSNIGPTPPINARLKM
ncbi:BgTH12-06965 [Blumeria graminis f. sp. triticale]|uniref:Bgt-2353 n=3 Tax=Blumeria graminis TaxID=34373 RepID=A0A381L4U9_BLUGR|nr:Component of the Trk1p-Trk2p potassium transport system [Blumeria graminis f. sp. tritici 96224]CAD6506033.1 BgTH12-06965 [Blumeria graminis f. sp. triticale]VDB94680.1 Bgt-2353 [Blumeria graminis f. sp. tritici]